MTDHIIDNEVFAQPDIIEVETPGPQGPALVASVNGKQGAVVLGAADVGADAAGAASSAVAAHVAATDPHGDRAYFNGQKGIANGVATLDSGGQIPIAQIPPAAIERLVVVADAATRYALTTATVQNGDTVKQVDTNTLWFVVDQTQLSTDAGYVSYTAGGASTVAWTNVTGVPAAVSSLTTDTYANIRTNFPAATYTGKRARCTDLNCDVYSDGANWLPVNGKAQLGGLTATYGIAASGTINIGSVNNYTSSYALDRVYSEGLFLYFTNVPPLITAGWYWVVMSSTTQGTIYSTSWSGGVPAIGSAINFTAGTSYAFSTGEFVLPTPVATVPGNALGSRGVLQVEASFRRYASSYNSNVWARFGGTKLLFGNTLTNLCNSFSCVGAIFSRSASAQAGSGNWALLQSTTLVSFDAAVDSTLSQPVEISMQQTGYGWLLCDMATVELSRLS